MNSRWFFKLLGEDLPHIDIFDIRLHNAKDINGNNVENKYDKILMYVRVGPFEASRLVSYEDARFWLDSMSKLLDKYHGQ